MISKVINIINVSIANLGSYNSSDPVNEEIDKLSLRTFTAFQNKIHTKTDALMAILLFLEWIIVVLMILVGPHNSFWEEGFGEFVAIISASIILIVPVFFSVQRKGSVLSRHLIGLGQILYAVFMAKKFGSEIAWYFLTFGSLSLLSLYRDWKLVFFAALIVLIDQVIRGVVWSESFFGIFSSPSWSWVEHTGWAFLIYAFIIYLCIRAEKELFAMAKSGANSLYQIQEVKKKQQELEDNNKALETTTILFRKSQEQLEFINDKLTQKAIEVRVKNKELKSSKEEIRKNLEELKLVDKYKNEFLANMSHELRTPLNSILSLSHLLKKNNYKNLTEKDIEFATVIEKAGKNLLSLIDDVLDIARIEAGKMRVSIKPIDLNILIGNMVKGMKGISKKTDVTLRHTISHKIQKELCTDEKLLSRILENLLSNAMKFGKAGGRVELMVNKLGKSEIMELNIDDFADIEEAISFSVRDYGIGIHDKNMEIIFNDFTQIEGGTTRQHGGMGVGLAISRRLSALLEGMILVNSQIGIGSTFSLVLPLNDKNNR